MVALALTSLALAVALTAPALAWRHPTATEGRAIAAAAATAPHAGNSRVHVSNIRVSTVGPWASATVAIAVAGGPDYATAIVHKVRHSWRFASVGTSGEWCVMPATDRRNLGFSTSLQCNQR